MKEGTRSLLDKAARAIHAAEVLLESGEMDFATGRAYCAMFYTAEALLYERGLRSRKHSGVHSLLGEHLVKPGLTDQKFHRWLVTAFSRRLQCDYAFDATVSPDEVHDTIAQAAWPIISSGSSCANERSTTCAAQRRSGNRERHGPERIHRQN